MSKGGMSAMLKNRMLATQQASELEVGNAAYETLFQTPSNAPQPKVCKLPISKLHPFFTADIGFKPYSASKLQALAEHMAAEGQLERIIVRSIPYRDEYEILAGHNRTNAGRLNNWSEIEAEIVDADDERATTIAIATNLLRRQDLTIIERGQAYKALLEAQRRQGFRSDIQTSGEIRQKFDSGTFGEIRQRYSARKIVAEFFGVTEYEIRKAIKMTQLISELQEILEEQPKLLPLACAEKIADYGHDLDITQREMRYASIPDLRNEYHPGMEIDCIVKVFDPDNDKLEISIKETEVNPFFGAEQRHPVGSRRLAVISGKYGGGVFCNLPDGVVCMCNYSYQHEDADFMVGENVMLIVQRYEDEKLQMYGKIMSKW